MESYFAASVYETADCLFADNFVALDVAFRDDAMT
ncbi:unnamed protein product, partial [Didymodactylos carnosus]